jgi:hypothetical protein
MGLSEGRDFMGVSEGRDLNKWKEKMGLSEGRDFMDWVNVQMKKKWD